MAKKSGFWKYGVVLKRIFSNKKGMAEANGDSEKKWRGFIEKLFEKKDEEKEKGGIPPAQVAKDIGKVVKRVPGSKFVQNIYNKPAVQTTGKIAKGIGYKAPKYAAGAALGLKESVKGTGWMFVLLAVVLYLFDMLFQFNGINMQRFLDNLVFTSMESYIGWFFNSIVLTLLIAYWVLYRPGAKEFASWFLVAETLSLVIFLGGGGRMLIHLAFVIAFYFLYIRYSAEDKAGGYANANFIFFFLLAFDFFGYGLLAEFVKNPIISNRLIIPIWFYFALVYTHEQEKGFAINLVIILVILINVFYFVGGINGLQTMSGVLTQEEIQEGTNFWRVGWKRVKDSWNDAIEGFRENLDNQLEYATGGYYKGKVERNKIGPLGVFIEEVKTSQPRYYEGEEIIIWGKVKALSLGNSINLNISCHKKDEELYATETRPNESFSIYSLETRDFECVFDPNKKKIGTPWYADLGIHTITVDAKFNFETLAYLKSYFIDLERKRDMVREGLDPFKEFGIKDTEPIAVYTDGPVIIGMETTSPMIEVGEGAITQPRLGITLENKEGWEGRIRSLSELILLTPNGIDISQPNEDCTIPFKEYSKTDCINGFCCYSDSPDYDDGKSSCEKFVYKPCVDICANQKIANGKAENKKDAIGKCKEDVTCRKDYKDCKEECDILFGDEENEKLSYKGYAIDTSEIKVRSHFKDVDRYRSFSCRLTVDQGVLGTTPITVKYFRAKARYDFILSEDIDVQVQSKPGTAAKIDKKISVKGDILNHIIQFAGNIGVPQNYALALAYQESKWRHCCEVAGENENKNCKTTGDSTCSPSNILKSPDGSSFGIMQLNKKAHCAWFYPNEICDDGKGKKEAEYVKYGCSDEYKIKNANDDCKDYKNAECKSDETAYDIDCNIKIGLTYLKNMKAAYGSGCKKSSDYANAKNYPKTYPTFLKGCEECFYCPSYVEGQGCVGGETPTYYYEYTDWNAALRAYNGWGCPDAASRSFVEDVIDKKEKIENGEIGTVWIDIKDVSEKDIQPPSYLNVDELFGSCTLTWGVSPSSDVQYYYIYREKKGEDEKLLKTVEAEKDKIKYEYTDTIEEKGEYYYHVGASVKNVYDYSFDKDSDVSRLKSDLIAVTTLGNELP